MSLQILFAVVQLSLRSIIRDIDSDVQMQFTQKFLETVSI